MIHEHGKIGGTRNGWGNGSIWGKPAPSANMSTTNPTWDRTRAAAVIDRFGYGMGLVGALERFIVPPTQNAVAATASLFHVILLIKIPGARHENADRTLLTRFGLALGLQKFQQFVTAINKHDDVV
jgi:hypothetical protein